MASQRRDEDEGCAVVPDEGEGCDEVASVSSYVCHCAIYVPVFSIMVLDGHLGSNSDLGKGAGVLVV